ncbi:hypothetical protein [Anabaena lutea]|uniref:Novel STAND NTPase 1 domain-containing protein n=1 Tax=Anabaena lutea FACHB-196 TaxID=2692881 RepID=A0ABR8FEG7_9NOST|nr:hypothetical protein [Anabaena lutea]MBD2568383.1 hypothetical protein [Anabaena lutea FACHB-196]
MTTLVINPYKAGPPVTGSDFYGRKDLLAKVNQALASSNVVLLQGQRRIGKSSFLQKLYNFLKDEKSGMGKVLPLVPVIFDIQRYVQDTLPQFQNHLANAIAKEINIEVPTLNQWESSHTLFRDEWLPQVFENLGNQELVIIVDEFDNLGEQTINKSTEVLVSFLGELVKGEHQLKWVLTVGKDIGKLPIQYDPIVSSSKEERISFFSQPETKQLIIQPTFGILTYEETAIDRIYELTNGQPHLTQALCSEVFEYVVLDEEREIATVNDVNFVIPKTLQAYQGAIASIARVPTIEERVLATVASLTSDIKKANRDNIVHLLMENRVHLNREELNNTLESLIKWELLKGNNQAIGVAVEIVRIWVTENIPLEPSREEEIDIHQILANNRCELADKARQAGSYDFAIKDYKEVLVHIPNHCSALRGLADIYYLTEDLAGRAEALCKLYLYDHNVLPEMVEALAKYAQYAENKGDFSVASEQYEKLIKLQNSNEWQRGLIRNLTEQLEKCLEEVETLLNIEQRNNSFDPEEELAFIQEIPDEEDLTGKTQEIQKIKQIEEFETQNQHNAMKNNSDLSSETKINHRTYIVQRNSSISPIDLARKQEKIRSEKIRILESKIISIQEKIIKNNFNLSTDNDEYIYDNLKIQEQKVWVVLTRIQISKADINPATAAKLVLSLEEAEVQLSNKELRIITSYAVQDFSALFITILFIAYIVLVFLFIKQYLVGWIINIFIAFLTIFIACICFIGIFTPIILLLSGIFDKIEEIYHPLIIMIAKTKLKTLKTTLEDKS